MILHGKNMYTEIDLSKDTVCPDENSISSMSSNNYFESLITNCIQFFDEEYLFGVPWFAAFEDELCRILDNPDETNNLGKLIYTIYYSYTSKGKSKAEVKDFIYKNFFDLNGYNYRSLSSTYLDHINQMKVLCDRLSLDLPQYKEIATKVDTLIAGSNYDFSSIGIQCTVYRNSDFDIKPSALYQIAMHYDAIILSHNVPNKEYWEIEPVVVDGVVYTSLQECIEAIPGRTILVLSCNDDRHKIKNIQSKIITVPEYSLISELYIEN